MSALVVSNSSRAFFKDNFTKITQTIIYSPKLMTKTSNYELIVGTKKKR